MWLILLALVILTVASVILTETEKFGWATLVLIVSVVGVQLLHVANLVGWVQDHSGQTVLYLLGYVLAGVVWSFIKWFSFLMGFRDKFLTMRRDFIRSLGTPEWLSGMGIGLDGPIPPGVINQFQEYVMRQGGYNYGGSKYRDNRLTERPRAFNNKARIISWMSLWPCSVIGTVLNDPMKRLFTLLFNLVKGLYQQMSDYLFSKYPELK